MQKFVFVSVKCRQLQLAPDILNRVFAPGPHWGQSPNTPVVALQFGSRFVCAPSLQISCATLSHTILAVLCSKIFEMVYLYAGLDNIIYL